LILHIPHASTSIPFTDGFIDPLKTAEQIELLTDWYSDELFDDGESTRVIADFSRVFCDVERFRDDDRETMSSRGMGVIYTHADDGTLIRKVNDELRERILREFYEPYHQKLTNEVTLQLEQTGRAKIIDCHSYPDIPLKRDLNQKIPRPDFNIGINNFHTPLEWIEASKYFFKARGYSLGIDWPYSRTIVPFTFLNKNSDVQSIMMEVNRKLYLKPNGIEKNQNFWKTRSIVQDWLGMIRSLRITKINKIKLDPYLNGSDNYGMAIHPVEWWGFRLTKYLEITNNLDNTTELHLMMVSKKEIMYCFPKNSEQKTISKKTIMEVLFPLMN
jgi:N-formylglutamate amidohydrolase